MMIGQVAIRGGGGWCGTRGGEGEGEDDRQPNSTRRYQKQIMGIGKTSKKRNFEKKLKVHTPIAKYNVRAIDPK
jgi:hypothetical protein